MPKRLRPTAPNASDAILVGDPGRALLLAQELLTEPKMSNHARGLWGYSGKTPKGHELTIQATGIGGPSAVLVLSDLVELGVRRVVRAGTCVGLTGDCQLGGLLAVEEAIAEDGGSASLGIPSGARVRPSAELAQSLRTALGAGGRAGVVASFDLHPAGQAPTTVAVAADMQTAPLLAKARSLDIAAAAVLIVIEMTKSEERLETDPLAAAERRAGRVASTALSG